jgi:hypothetical protein
MGYKNKIETALALLLFGLVGCGGGSSGSASVKTGYFIDSPVEGLEYTSGSISGITGSRGSFQYEEGQPVTFKIGNLTLGTVTIKNGETTVFPTDLVSAASDLSDPVTNSNVQLMAQVLQSLDTGGDTSTRILISSDQRAALKSSNVRAIDLSAANVTSSDITPLLPNGTTLTDVNTATSHLRKNLVQAYSGTWTGTYSGGDSGTCTVTITRSASSSSLAYLNTGTTDTSTSSSNISSTGTISSSGSAASGASATSASSANAATSGTTSNTGTSSTNASSSTISSTGTLTVTPSVTINGSCTNTAMINAMSNATLASNGAFSGSMANGATFSGQFQRNGTMTGTWVNSKEKLSGTWTLTKQ